MSSTSERRLCQGIVLARRVSEQGGHTATPRAQLWLGPTTGAFVVARRHRLARDVLAAAVVARLVEREPGSSPPTAPGDSPEAALLRTMIDAFAPYERALIRARTRAAQAVKKARGERTGGVPYGWRVGAEKRLEPDDAEARVLSRARELRTEGRSLGAVVATLVEEGHRPRSGRKWHVQVLARVVGA